MQNQSGNDQEKHDRPEKDGKNFAQNSGLPGIIDLFSRPGGVKLTNQGNKEQEKLPPVGVAKMLPDESIQLNLKAHTKDLEGEAELIYRPGDKDYQDILKHLGGLTPGETKLVAPFQDPKDQKDQKDQKDPQDKVDPKDGTDTGKPGALDQPPPPPSKQFSDKVNDTYNKMSDDVRNIVSRDGATLVPTRRITDTLPELKGQRPRGWPPGSTWDAVDGAYSPSKKLIVVAEEKEVKPGIWAPNNRTEDLVRHETGHAVNAAMDYISDDADFLQSYEAEKKAIHPINQKPLAYFLQGGGIGADETVAEAIAASEGGATGGLLFEKSFTATIDLIKKRIQAFAAAPPSPAGAASTPPP
ncbi:MAG: hypothetical protein BWY75_00240 [bacterium ADurb.Bin425]|jgi:hypothetical protein|uniref:Anthrax toxin lethal/endema factor N-/C-terminal domain-containing protein n=1 Tax=Candidatus Obscuribacter phosphatis TaxID=1906157 RepID=A0A8J7PJ57_9BACT|nr:hypothetical protein [Candidatus Obscuribacter phosphatis]OPZ91592.1 MAG: hypothetical protein BWY75_00240 [bacterium ADurb.Bin425]